jgi:methyl-accepting chemotaxis protein
VRILDLEQGSRAFRRKSWKLDLLSPIPAFVLTLGYLTLLFDLASLEGVALASCLMGSAIVVGFVAESGRRRQAMPITRYLEENAGGVDAGKTGADASLALRAVVSLPMQRQRVKVLGGLAPIIIVPPLMWAMGFDAWLSFERVRSLAMISLAVSLMCGMLVFYWAKHSFVGLRMALASVACDPSSRSDLIARHSVQHKLLLAVAVPAFVSVLLVVDVVREDMRSTSETEAAQWALLAVDSIAGADAELPLAARVASQLPPEKFWPTPLDTAEIRLDRLGDVAGEGASGPFLEALDRRLEIGETTGSIVPALGPEVGAFRRLDGATILVSKVQRSDLEPRSASLGWVMGLVCFGVLGVAVLIGRLAAAEVSGALDTLEVAAERMAAGDLKRDVAYESEDEFGNVGRALAAVGETLRCTIERVASTAESAERTAEGVSAVLFDIADTNAKQSEQMQRANEVIGRISGQVDAASRFAVDLDSTIDKSGSSLLELGATGNELNETASVLTSKVDAVSDSLEQMVHSVKQVAGTSERLAAASEETSSSMEEMASAMRAVDTSAETTANLSREVVSKAELGQAKVVQTIAGMEAIREATDVAEKVIRGLGARTNEIGGILDVIDDVADETNLLALNAAIIAAQAGEHGKAFSVVADEIKELADRVLASTKEIGSLIRAVQNESENAIGAIEAGSASVMSGVDLSAEAGRTLEEITVASRESGLRIGEIVTSVREQTKAASHVVSLMERVRESAEEIGAAGSQQDHANEIVYQSSLTMREVAQQVHRTTEEQAAGFGRIRESVAGVREAVEQISDSLGEQAGSCRQVTESLGRVSLGTQSKEEAAEKLRESMRELISQAVSLREDAERFRV